MEKVHCPQNDTPEVCLITVMWICWQCGWDFCIIFTSNCLFLFLHYSAPQSVVYRTLGEVCDVRTIFKVVIIIIFLCWHLPWWSKSNWWIKLLACKDQAALICTSIHFIFHHLTFTRKSFHFQVRTSLMKKIVIKFQPLSTHLSNTLCDQMGSIQTALGCIPNYNEKHVIIVWVAS